jgi:cytidine deaminase
MNSRDTELVELALQVREKAYAPYSKFLVGAALRAVSGRSFLGVNVENASYGLTMCAERSAIVSAVSAGETQFEAIAIVADTEGAVSPCGACRQVLAEFGLNWRVILSNLKGDQKEYLVSDLLPGAFEKSDLDKSTQKGNDND